MEDDFRALVDPEHRSGAEACATHHGAQLTAAARAAVVGAWHWDSLATVWQRCPGAVWSAQLSGALIDYVREPLSLPLRLPGSIPARSSTTPAITSRTAAATRKAATLVS